MLKFMKVDRYEIDMLNVKNADAFLIHLYTVENDEYIVLIDGGNYQDGEKITNFIKNNYGRQEISLAICTHCDKDHFGGIMYLLEQMRDNVENHIPINMIWIQDPAKHVDKGVIKWITEKEQRDVAARSVFDLNGGNLWDVLDELVATGRILRKEPFSNPQVTGQMCVWREVLKVIGPTVEYYTSFVPDFRNDLKRRKDGYVFEEPEEIDIEEADESLSKIMDEADDDGSPHNRPSVIVLFTPYEGAKYLFTGDACRDSFQNLHNERLYNALSHLTWLKVPHHGSIHNLDSTLIKHFSPTYAYVSTEKYNHYLSRAVVNAFKKVGTRVYATNVNGSMCHVHKIAFREGYSKANPL